MSSTRTTDSDGFRQAMAPMVANMREFTVAVDQVGNRHGTLPTADSPGMREISDEQQYGRRSTWRQPITETHGLGELTLRAAADYVRTFAQAFTTEYPPLYGHLVVARSALEAAVVSWWLSEPSIARDTRVKRGLSEYLYSATEEGWLGLRDDAAERVNELVARAASLGWRATDRSGRPWSLASRGKPSIDGVTRPSMPAGINRVRLDDDDSRIGKLQWSRLSAVSHVTFMGLREALHLGDAIPNAASGLTAVPIGTDSAAVSVQAFCITKVLRRAATARFELMGWLDDEWNTACQVAEQQEHALLRAYQAAQPLPPAPSP